MLDPFEILRKRDHYEKSLKKIVVLATLAFTLCYNLFVLIIIGATVFKLSTSIFYVVTKLVKLIVKLLAIFTACAGTVVKYKRCSEEQSV